MGRFGFFGELGVGFSEPGADELRFAETLGRYRSGRVDLSSLYDWSSRRREDSIAASKRSLFMVAHRYLQAEAQRTLSRQRLRCRLLTIGEV